MKNRYKRIKDYKCTNCELKIHAFKLITYSCPNCGELLEPEDEKFREEIAKKVEQVDESKIEHVLNKMPVVEKITNKDEFKAVKKYIDIFIKLLRKEETPFEIKALIAACMIYIISPLDLIPDFIPFIGFLDDIVIVILVAKMIGDKFDDFNIVNKNKASISQMVYVIINTDHKPIYNYTEEMKRRIWLISGNEVKKYNLNMFKNSLIRTGNFINHPYLPKTLVPLDSFDKLMIDDMIEEQKKFAIMLGAKTIKYTYYEFDLAKKSLKSKLKNGSKIELDIDFDSKKENRKEFTYYQQYDDFVNIDIEFVEDIIWFYTYESIFKGLLEKRILRNVKREKFEYELSSSRILSLESRVNLLKKNVFKIDLDMSQILERRILMDIEFFDMPDDLKRNKQKIYKDIIENLNERRKLIEEDARIL